MVHLPETVYCWSGEVVELEVEVERVVCLNRNAIGFREINMVDTFFGSVRRGVDIKPNHIQSCRVRGRGHS